MSAILDLACELIRRRSVTPDDAGCQDVLIARLERMGFRVERMPANGVSNVWARRGDTGPVFAFAGHTDVVPTGPESGWRSPPFEPVVRDGRLYGRGAADMKGSLAAMLVATEQFLSTYPDHTSSIAFLITSDEEGPATHGTRHVIEQLTARGEKIDFCLVGEPSSRARLGDVIRVGRRGSLNGRLTVRGKQGHVAYPELALNPIHAALTALHELAGREWDAGQAPFPPTSFQISNIAAGTGADNVIPGSLEASFNFRYSPAHDADSLKNAVAEILDRHGLDWRIDWRESGAPFYTEPGRLRDAVDGAVRSLTGSYPEHSTGGGTSDGRFIAPYGTQVVELGPVNASIHQIDEWVGLEELDQLGRIYEKLMINLLCAGENPDS